MIQASPNTASEETRGQHGGGRSHTTKPDHKMSEISFPTPDGFVPPEGVSTGGTFESLATLELADGKLILKAIDGLPVESAKEEASEPENSPEEEAMPEDFKSAVMRGLQGAK